MGEGDHEEKEVEEERDQEGGVRREGGMRGI